MGMVRKALLWASENSYLKARVPRLFFVRRAVRRFLPGEDVTAAIDVAQRFQEKGITTVFTHLGENIANLAEATRVTRHYLEVLKKVAALNLDTEISLKLTQIGLDLSLEQTHQNFESIARQALGLKNFVWIDMEGTAYTEVTIDFYRRVRREYPNVGLCLQAYLYRSQADLEELLKQSAAIRLVKGAYHEPRELAFPNKKRVDQNFLSMATRMLQAIREEGQRAAFATHDVKLISQIQQRGDELNIPRKRLEFQMLYGIKPDVQLRLVEEGYQMRVLISYGDAWYPWYMRRLAERPANLFFVLRNLMTR